MGNHTVLKSAIQIFIDDCYCLNKIIGCLGFVRKNRKQRQIVSIARIWELGLAVVKERGEVKMAE